jgi:signal transduction histidine kinase
VNHHEPFSVMLTKLKDALIPLLLKAGRKSRLVQIGIYSAIILPVTVIAVLAYRDTYHDMTEGALSRRKSLAALASSTLEQRFQRLTDLGVSLATRVRFRQFVHEAKWDDAIGILEDVPRDFPFIERLFLADPSATLMADTPALPNVRGKSFSDRDWYHGVSRNWRPYISDVYQRAAEPRFNVVAAAIPVKDEERIVGILVLQVQLNALVEWTNSIDIGQSGFTYVIDRKGQLATHPKLPSSGQILDYSSVPVVQKVLNGHSGVETMLDPLAKDERVAAYAPIPGLGWGIIATEPAKTVFALRKENLNNLVIRHGLIFLISCLLAYVIVRMVSRLKQAEEKIHALNDELQQRADRLEVANKELESFSYSVSHDLRAPLRTIDGFSKALMEDYADKLDGEAKDFLQRVRAATQKMGQLIDDILNLSRVSRAEIKADRVDLSALANEIANELRDSAPGREVDFLIGDGISAIGDKRLLQIVLENLIGNAWKFTSKRRHARIEFGVSGDNGTRQYFVKDNGAGFDMAYVNKLFGAFQRLHPVSEFDGTGIGLATVQRVISRHRGRVWADSAVEQGATFYFTVG